MGHSDTAAFRTEGEYQLYLVKSSFKRKSFLIRHRHDIGHFTDNAAVFPAICTCHDTDILNEFKFAADLIRPAVIAIRHRFRIRFLLGNLFLLIQSGMFQSFKEFFIFTIETCFDLAGIWKRNFDKT